MSAMDANKCLPPELTVESVDDILYRIGLSFDSIRDRPKRKLIDHPLIAFFILSLFLIERIITFSLSEDNHLVFKALGSMGYFIGVRKHFDFFFILCSILALISQKIYYHNFRNSRDPTFLRLFQMMAGMVPPKSLGLTDEKDIIKLTKFTGKLYNFLNFHNEYPLAFLALVFEPLVYLLYTNLWDTLFYGIPNALLFTIWARYYWNFTLYQFLVFYVICLYLKMKIKWLNERRIEMKRRKRFIRIRETLQSFDSLYSEINEYNTTFCSKFLLIFWLTYGLNLVLFLYITIFIPMAIFLKFIFIYALIVFSISFLFVIFTASSVTYSANKSYKTLNSLIISYSKHNKHLYYTRTSTKLKVWLIPINIYFINLIVINLDEFVNWEGG